jgi:hypothetical protein
MDVDGNGVITFHEFTRGILGNRGAEEHTSLETGDGHEHEDRVAEAAARMKTRVLSLGEAQRALREHIEGSVTGGDGQMLREFNAFRQHSGSGHGNVTFEAFKVGLAHMNIAVSDETARQFFASACKYDANGDGALSFHEFVTGILGSGGAEEHTSLETGEGHEHEDRVARQKREQAALVQARLLSLPAAKKALREHIEGSVTGGGGEMLREFNAFRQHSGSGHGNVTFEAFKVGLAHMNIAVSEKVARAFFDEVDIGLGRTVALHHRSSTSYHIHEENRTLFLKRECGRTLGGCRRGRLARLRGVRGGHPQQARRRGAHVAEHGRGRARAHAAHR